MKVVFYLLSALTITFLNFMTENDIVQNVDNHSICVKTDNTGNLIVRPKIKRIVQSKYYIYYNGLPENVTDSLAERVITKYDKEGMIKLKEYYGSADILISRNKYIYNDGYLVEILCYDGESEFKERKVNKYNENGFLSTQSTYDIDDEHIMDVIYLSDDPGKVEEIEYKDAKDNLTIYYIRNTYDNTGNVVERFRSEKKDGPFSRTVFYYNPDNTVSGSDEYSDSGELLESLTFDYVYDEYANWIECTTKNFDIPVFVERKNITYR